VPRALALDGPRGGVASLWRLARPQRARLLLAVLLTSVNKAADVVLELLIGAAVDVLVRGEDAVVATWFGVEGRFEQLVVLAALNAVAWVVESLSQYAAALQWRGLAQTVQHEVRTDLYEHVQELEVAWFEESTSGGLLSVVNYDVNQLERFLDVRAAAVIRLALNVVLVGAVFAASSLTLTLLAFLPIPVIV
jgi:ATP-binding cassette subfamily B protein